MLESNELAHVQDKPRSKVFTGNTHIVCTNWNSHAKFVFISAGGAGAVTVIVFNIVTLFIIIIVKHITSDLSCCKKHRNIYKHSFFEGIKCAGFCFCV